MPTPESARTLLLAALEQVVVEEVDELWRRPRVPCLNSMPAVDVLSVLAEDDDVDLFGMLHRAGHALVILHRANAGVEVENLAQSDIERADAAADGRGERSLDARRAGRVPRRLSRRAARC